MMFTMGNSVSLSGSQLCWVATRRSGVQADSRSRQGGIVSSLVYFKEDAPRFYRGHGSKPASTLPSKTSSAHRHLSQSDWASL